MFRNGIGAGTAAVLLALTAAFAAAGQAGPAEAAGMKRTITMVAVEPKGGTTVDKEPFPTAALPEGKGYELKVPNAEGRWEVSTYRWEPNQIIVNQGDEVTLEILGVNGKEHPTTIDGTGTDADVSEPSPRFPRPHARKRAFSDLRARRRLSASI